MTGRVEVIGVHPVDGASEPCHLLEVVLVGPHEQFDWGAVTQETPGQQESDWQVSYDEQALSEGPEQARYSLFFHYLELDQPLLTPWGPGQLPTPSPIPDHLVHVEYLEP